MISPFTPIVIACALVCVAVGFLAPLFWVVAGLALLLAVYDILDPVP